MRRYPTELAGLALFLTAAAPAHAAERHDVNVAAGRLGDAIIALGRQTDSSIGLIDQSLADLPVRGVTGRLTAGKALDRMLDGGPARAQRQGASGWRIVRAPRRAPVVAALTPVAYSADDGEAAIIVTGAKRDVPLSRYPGAIEIVGGGLSSADSAGGTEAILSRVASLSSTHVGSGRNKLFIRAIADSGFTGPTQATTGQYLGDIRLTYAAPDPDLRLYDVAGVEVLEGPQGTLYGAGSLGGILRVIPNAPDVTAFGGQISSGVSATQYGAMGGDLSAVVNVPIVQDVAALRVVGYGIREGGYIDDLLRDLDDVNTTKVQGGRASLRILPNPEWSIDLGGVYQRIDSDDAQYASRSVGDLSRASPVEEGSLSDYWLGTVRIQRRWDDLMLVSTAGYVHHDLDERYDATVDKEPPSLFAQRNRTRLFSTETRLARDMRDGLGWLVGFSYLRSASRIYRSLGPVDLPVPATGVKNRISEWTLFGEASIEATPDVIVTLGGRFTSSRLSGTALDPIIFYPVAELARAEDEANRREQAFLPSLAALSDTLVPGATVFVRFQQGFRPGGLAVDDYRVRRFRNDRTSSVEAGIRSGLAGRDPISFAASVAYTDWRNIQADLTDRLGLPTTTNIGDGRIVTLEGRVTVLPIPDFSIDASAIYNDSRLDQPTPMLRTLSFAGQALSLPNVANVSGRLAGQYRIPLGPATMRLTASARYVGKSRLGIGPIFGREQGDYVDTGLSASLARGPMQWSIDVTNLLDSKGNRFALGTPFDLSGDDFTPMRPRTIRVGMDFRF